MRLLFAACVLLPLSALAADRLNIKTGLWEVTSTTQMSGMPPLPKELLDKMSPEQKAQLQQSMKQAGSGTPHTETSRECITERDLERPFESANPEECKSEIIKSTRTTQEVKLTCSGKYKGNGMLRINTPNPNTMIGDLEVSVGDGENSMTVKADMKGRWLGADCGEEADDDEDYDDADDVDDESEDDA